MSKNLPLEVEVLGGVRVGVLREEGAGGEGVAEELPWVEEGPEDLAGGVEEGVPQGLVEVEEGVAEEEGVRDEIFYVYICCFIEWSVICKDIIKSII
jgi:hypothetical protein